MSDMLFSIRPACPGDAPELLRLNTAFNGPGDQTIEGIEKALKDPGGERVLVAQGAKGQGLLGFCCCQLKRSFCYREPVGEITEFYVDPAFRRQGVGRALLKEALCLCRAQGAEEITLLTGGDNLPAQALYAAGGFVPSGELHMALEG